MGEERRALVPGRAQFWWKVSVGSQRGDAMNTGPWICTAQRETWGQSLKAAATLACWGLVWAEGAHRSRGAGRGASPRPAHTGRR